jgi:hypothetical protein
VISRRTLRETREADVEIARSARPHHFGLAETLLRELDAEPAARGVAAAWRPRIARLRQSEPTEVKVTVLEALGTLSRALLIARAGRGLAGDDTAQLHARSALFLLVQGQNADVRREQLLFHELAAGDHP